MPFKPPCRGSGSGFQMAKLARWQLGFFRQCTLAQRRSTCTEKLPSALSPILIPGHQRLFRERLSNESHEAFGRPVVPTLARQPPASPCPRPVVVVGGSLSEAAAERILLNLGAVGNMGVSVFDGTPFKGRLSRETERKATIFVGPQREATHPCYLSRIQRIRTPNLSARFFRSGP